MAFVGFGKVIPEEARDNLGLPSSERLRLLCLREMQGVDAIAEGRLDQELQVIQQLDLNGFSWRYGISIALQSTLAM